MTDAGTLERRSVPDRRAGRASLRCPERRTGFDRRAIGTSRVGRLLDAYRRRPVLIACCALGIAALSAADLLLTWRLISLGAHEVNPVMARLFERGVGSAATLKAPITVAVAGGIWLMRRYRRVLEFSLMALALLAGLVAYQVVGLVAASG
ncbi:MAG: hypothetical protein KJ698_01065 [Actinobacteria bacterium]|nr:hypothetical protein [Actinomycetota bacterium]MBU1495032.1 hypothetical protein [Actinomycetota bacterium]